jgi:hypothetical protein
MQPKPRPLDNYFQKAVGVEHPVSPGEMPTKDISQRVDKILPEKPILHKLSIFSRFFKFSNRTYYLIFGSLLLAHGVTHSFILYNYFQDPDGTKKYIQTLPSKFENLLSSKESS